MDYSVVINFSRLALPPEVENALFREISFGIQTILNECNVEKASFEKNNDENHRYGIHILMPQVCSSRYNVLKEVLTSVEDLVKRRNLLGVKVTVKFPDGEQFETGVEPTKSCDKNLSKLIEADIEEKKKKILQKFACDENVNFVDIFKRCAFIKEDEVEKIFLYAGYLATTSGREKISSNDLFDAIDMYEGKKSDNDFDYIEKLADSFIPTDPEMDFESLVLPEKSMRQIDVSLALSQEDNLKKYYDWGLDSVDKYPRAILSFYGPPGTGKTHAAQAVAKKLGKKIIIAGCPEIKSKYQGESAKNIAAVFHAAQRADAVLFFDEADSIISRRHAEQRNGSDDDINTMKNAVLTRLETHKGVVIFATNFIASYDPALETRIQCVEFPAPDLDTTKQIWRKKVPSRIPGYQTIDFDALGQWCFERGFCGRDIKTAVINTCKNALHNNISEITHEMLLAECSQILEERLTARSAETNKNTLHDVIDENQSKETSLAAFIRAEAETFRIKYFDDVPYADDLDFQKVVALYSEFTPGEEYRAVRFAKILAATEPEQTLVKLYHLEQAAKTIKRLTTSSPDLEDAIGSSISEIIEKEEKHN